LRRHGDDPGVLPIVDTSTDAAGSRADLMGLGHDEMTAAALPEGICRLRRLGVKG
jgi:hypothetical protein